jgi:hypothetical protein
MGSFEDIAHVIQLAIAPVFMLTAIAGFVNALVGRLSRAVDRRRSLDELLPAYEGAMRADMETELALLARRIRLILWAIGMAVFSALVVCLLIGVAFVGAYVGVNPARAVALLFILAVAALTGCLLLFFREVVLAVVNVHHDFRSRHPGQLA